MPLPIVPPTQNTAPIDPARPLPTPRPSPVAAAPAIDPLQNAPFRISRWIVLLGTALLALVALAIGLLWLRRHRQPDESFEIPIDAVPATDLPGDTADLPPIPATPRAFPPAPAQPVAAPPSPAPVFIREPTPQGARARLELTVRPIRAGTNLTSAAVDYEIDIRNTGDADAVGIRLDLRLLSASADQDAILTALYAAPIDTPAVAPFEVPAGEHVSLGGMAMLPRDALSVMTVRDRDFFVPLLSLNLVYGWGGAARGQTASAHVIGIERPGDVKMAPFRLDTGPRMYDNVGARAHTLTIDR